MLNIPEQYGASLWSANPFLQILHPFKDLYEQDKSKDKRTSSNLLWCIVWKNHPDEQKNRFYRLSSEDLERHCLDFEPSYNPEDSLFIECTLAFNENLLTKVEAAYKKEKEHLLEIQKALIEMPLTIENLAEIVKIKAMMPKLYSEFAKVDREFTTEQSKKRVHGGRAQTQRELGKFRPEE